MNPKCSVMIEVISLSLGVRKILMNKYVQPSLFRIMRVRVVMVYSEACIFRKESIHKANSLELCPVECLM